MAKVKIKYKLNDVEKNIIGIKNNNKIIFNDDEFKFNVIIFDNEVIINRENNEIVSEMKFARTSSCKYFIKNYNKYVDIEIDLIKLYICNNLIQLVYKIEEEIFNFKMDIEVI